MINKSQKWAVFAGSCFYIGFLPKFPGTWGSLFALPLIYLASIVHSLFGPFSLIVIFSIITLWAAGPMEKKYGPDPGQCVSDEFAGQATVFLFIPLFSNFFINLAVFAAGFILFRLFDILKPLGIGAIQNSEGGWGVLLDDLLAGIYAQLVLLLILFFLRDPYLLPYL